MELQAKGVDYLWRTRAGLACFADLTARAVLFLVASRSLTYFLAFLWPLYANLNLLRSWCGF
jgi:hypothetical protein